MFHWWFLSPFCKNVLFMFDSHSWDNVKSYFCHNKNLNRHFQSCLLIVYHFHFSLLIQQHRISLKFHINALQMLKLLSARWQWEKCLSGLHMVTDVLFLLPFLKIWVYLHLIDPQQMIKQQLTSAATRTSSHRCSRSHTRGSKFWGI